MPLETGGRWQWWPAGRGKDYRCRCLVCQMEEGGPAQKLRLVLRTVKHRTRQVSNLRHLVNPSSLDHAKSKINTFSKLSNWGKLNNKQHRSKVLLNSFPKNGHTSGFCPQNQKLETLVSLWKSNGSSTHLWHGGVLCAVIIFSNQLRHASVRLHQLS